MSEHKIITVFNPDVEQLELEHQDFLCDFDAGDEFQNFNDFIQNDAFEYAEKGDGATYLVFNSIYDNDGNLLNKVLMAYFTLSATSIPYIDRIRLEPEEATVKGKEFDERRCGIPSLEIKMFAVDRNYQDTFYEYEGEFMPISAWILRMIIAYAYNMMKTVVGFKAVFLHSVPTAIEFYRKNFFHNAEKYMEPLYSLDDEYQAMYLSFCKVHINQDE